MAKEKLKNVPNDSAEIGASETDSPISLPAEASPEVAVADKFHGHGGSYVIDGGTQTRQPNQ